MNCSEVGWAMLFVSCTATHHEDPTDSWVYDPCINECAPGVVCYDGPDQVNTLSWSCDDSTGEYFYSVTTDGWAASITLDVAETVVWDGTNAAEVPTEHHGLRPVAYAEDGSWDRWEISLEYVPDAPVPGTSTAFECSAHGDDELSWMASMISRCGNTDCGIWGHNPEQWFNEEKGHRCFNFNP